MNPRYYYDSEEEYEEAQQQILSRNCYEDEQLIALAEEQFNEFFMDTLVKHKAEKKNASN